ncbi:unnamed protein product [Effrenium voratum]|uniref:Uncharacterized protein n=1 Tax=Effrenium voratum TaxID=2562239 RepID=A0AA36IKL7_9DINO|nr:unnamed protein product [Effrenium voratum]CAJ1428524.1 unnamed protein product [Effrenium voratum]
MGVKCGFNGHVSREYEPKPLAEIWAEARQKGLSEVIVVDGTNFLMDLATGPSWQLGWPGLPRLQEMEELLRAILLKIVEACPGAELHFVLDGMPQPCADAKEQEQLRRTCDKLLKQQEAVLTYGKVGYCPRGGGMLCMMEMKRVLLEVVKRIGGGHRILRAHSLQIDADAVTALYAKKQAASFLISNDGDFLVSFEGCVVPSKSFSFTEERQLRAKGLWVPGRLAALGLPHFESLKALACLAGTDFSTATSEEKSIVQLVEEVKLIAPSSRDASETLQWLNWKGQLGLLFERWNAEDCIIQDRDGQTLKRPISPLQTQFPLSISIKVFDWKAVAQHKLADAEVELFLRQYDLPAYGQFDGFDNAWTWKSSLACGLTCVFPPGDLDPVVRTFLAERVQYDLLQSYCSGTLSTLPLNLLHSLRNPQPLFISSEPADCLGQHEQKVSVMFARRVAGLLAGAKSDLPDSWEEEEASGQQFTFAVETISPQAILKCAPFAQKVATMEEQVAEFRKNQQEHKAAATLQEAQDCRQEALLVLEKLGPNLKDRKYEEAEAPSWLFDASPGHRFWFLATGSAEVPEEAEHVHGPMSNAAKRRLFLQVLATMVRDIAVARDHWQHLCKMLNVQVQSECIKLEGKEKLIKSSLILGSLCWKALKIIQDAFCLSGGQGFFFNERLPLDGGPVVLTEGHVHKARNGYRFIVRALGDSQEVPDSWVKAAQLKALTELNAQLQFSKNNMFIINHLGAEDAFKFHRRIVIVEGVPVRMTVKALD